MAYDVAGADTYLKIKLIENSRCIIDVEATNISYFGGTLPLNEVNTLKRLLFRATRGRAMMT